jgi:hypothetical protein
MTNERKLQQQLKSLNDKMDSLMVHLQVKSKETWVSGRFLATAYGLTRLELRALRRAGVSTTGEGNSMRYLLESLPEQLLIKKRETADKGNLPNI